MGFYFNRLAIVAAMVPKLVVVEAIIIFSAIVILLIALVGTTISQPGRTFV